MPDRDAIFAERYAVDPIVAGLIGGRKERMFFNDDICLHVGVRIAEDSRHARFIEGNASALSRCVETKIEIFSAPRRKNVVPALVVVRKIYRSADHHSQDGWKKF